MNFLDGFEYFFDLICSLFSFQCIYIKSKYNGNKSTKQKEPNR